MTTKNKVRNVLLAFSAAFLLTGCDPIEALPANYEEKIIDGDDIYENIMGTLYDTTASNASGDVLDRFMDIVSEDQYGKYSELMELANKSEEEIDAFVEAHAAYKHTNKVGDVEEDEFLASKYGLTVKEVRRERLANFIEAVTEAVNKSFYSDIVSKTFSDDTGKFYEKRLAYDYFASFFDVDLNHDESYWIEKYPDARLKKEDVSEYVHLDDGTYDDYITRRIVPTVLKDKLVEDYLVNSNYSTLGRAYGRKVNIIKLTRDEKFKELPDRLLNRYATDYIHDNTGTHAGIEHSFEDIADAWRGFKGLDEDGDPIELSSNDVSYKLLADCGYTFVTKTVDGTVYKYFAETQYGQLIEKYALIDEDNRFPSDEASDALNEFTANLTYRKEKGLTIKLAELALGDYTTDGWYVKNGGLTDLPSEIRDRLFNIKVARGVDNIAPEDAEHKYDSDNYVRNIKGKYYLTPKTSETVEDDSKNNNFVIYNEGSFYMVQVEEAVSTSKLDLDGKESYVEMHKDSADVLFTETVARKLADALGTKDTYTNKAYSELIKAYSIKYHDSSIYDYFKEKYPELFEDD